MGAAGWAGLFGLCLVWLAVALILTDLRIGAGLVQDFPAIAGLGLAGLGLYWWSGL